MRRSLLGFVFYGVVAVAGLPMVMAALPSAHAAELTLNERRAFKAYEEQTLPGLIQQVQQAAGFAVPVDIKWDTLALPDQSASFSEKWYLTDVFFTPLISALNTVGSDSMGKEALQAKLKSVVIYYDEPTVGLVDYAKGVQFSDGVLSLNFKPANNADAHADRAAAIVNVLNANL